MIIFLFIIQLSRKGNLNLDGVLYYIYLMPQFLVIRYITMNLYSVIVYGATYQYKPTSFHLTIVYIYLMILYLDKRFVLQI